MKIEEIKYLICHHSLTKDGATVSWSAIRRYHIIDLEMVDIGYQYGIELVGSDFETLVGRMLNEDGAHCKQQGMNHKSIGICFIGNYDLIVPPPKMIDAGVRLVKSLMEVFHIPKENVRGHRDFAPKSCPGLKFDMEQFRERL